MKTPSKLNPFSRNSSSPSDKFVMNRRRALGLAAGAAAATFAGSSLTACAKEGGGSGGYKVAMIVPTYDAVRWKAADGPFFIQEAQALGMNPMPIQSSNNDVDLQLKQVENALNQGIEGLVLAPVNVDAAKAMVQMANSAGVPVIAHNYVVPEAKLAGVSARDGIALGEMLGAAMVAMAPEGNYAIAKGEEGTDMAQLKAEGGMNILKPMIDSGTIAVVSDQWNRAWSGDLAQKQIEQALTISGNQLAGVLSYCDCMTYGIVQAIRAQGLAGKIIVSGEDCEPEMLKLILGGDAHVSAWTAFDQMGRNSAQLLFNALEGKSWDGDTYDNGSGETIPFFKTPLRNVTKDGALPDSISVAQFVDENPWWTTPAAVGL
ncbi:substrate-binding domain-containing protein [Rhodococcus ruber]|uniref:Substrate-binding domain-containing protein n=1 Tax=Rhodococcus ruber TaxID=1830 RepID=A0ABT4MMQ8_9NOCA|nr:MULTISPECIES: substrate-binding domain-containing protein [Rhodococcus]MCZ4522277.1 substrate-binding domain-containing protein [Rhodococcus ruber]MDI9933772.1 substrate-binding domain-containing protein [Rhodococcus sp. IEGM 1354]